MGKTKKRLTTRIVSNIEMPTTEEQGDIVVTDASIAARIGSQRLALCKLLMSAGNLDIERFKKQVWRVLLEADFEGDTFNVSAGLLDRNPTLNT